MYFDDPIPNPHVFSSYSNGCTTRSEMVNNPTFILIEQYVYILYIVVIKGCTGVSKTELNQDLIQLRKKYMSYNVS